MFGDGAGRGPDFTADALHRLSDAMVDFYLPDADQQNPYAKDAVVARVQTELARMGTMKCWITLC